MSLSEVSSSCLHLSEFSAPMPYGGAFSQLEGDFSLSGGSVCDRRVVQRHPAYVFGERVVRPLIDASGAVLRYSWGAIHHVFSVVDGVATRIFSGFPGARAMEDSMRRPDGVCDGRGDCCEIPSHSQEGVQMHENCPKMSTWLNFTKLMCEEGGGITLTPMRSHHTQPEKGIVVALRGFSKIVPAKDFCLCGPAIVEQYVKENALPLSEHLLSAEQKPYEPYFGAWYNRENQQVYLDVSVVFAEGDAENALQFARNQNQIAAYHISQGREIPTGGTGEV